MRFFRPVSLSLDRQASTVDTRSTVGAQLSSQRLL